VLVGAVIGLGSLTLFALVGVVSQRERLQAVDARRAQLERLDCIEERIENLLGEDETIAIEAHGLVIQALSARLFGSHPLVAAGDGEDALVRVGYAPFGDCGETTVEVIR
jgi:hypothetical protein